MKDTRNTFSHFFLRCHKCPYFSTNVGVFILLHRYIAFRVWFLHTPGALLVVWVYSFKLFVFSCPSTHLREQNGYCEKRKGMSLVDLSYTNSVTSDVVIEDRVSDAYEFTLCSYGAGSEEVCILFFLFSQSLFRMTTPLLLSQQHSKTRLNTKLLKLKKTFTQRRRRPLSLNTRK